MTDILTASNISLSSINASEKFKFTEKQHQQNVDNQQLQNDNPNDSKWVRCISTCKNAKFRRKFLHTLCLYSAFLAMASAKGLVGPTFLDIQSVSHVGLQQGTWLLTVMYVGYMSGAIMGGGILYNRVNRMLLFVIITALLGMTVVAIPWCSIFGAMLGVFCLMGICIGVIDSVANAEIINIWGYKGRPYMQTLHFVFSFGVSITPLYTGPFLSGNEAENQINGQLMGTGNESLINDSISDNVLRNGSFQENLAKRENSVLFIPFVISGSVGVCSSILCLLFLLCKADNSKTSQSTEDISKTKRDLPLLYKIPSLFFLSGIIAITCTIDDNLFSFLTTFCVRHLGWSKPDGSLLTSLVGFAVAVGRLLGICITNVISPFKVIFSHCLIMLVTFVILTISATHHWNLAIWIVTPFFGIGKAPVFAAVFTWTDEVFLPVTGKVSSLFFIVITITIGLNPLIIGYLMNSVSNMWFCYLFVVENSVLLVVVVFTAILSRIILKKFGGTYRNKQTEVAYKENLIAENVKSTTSC